MDPIADSSAIRQVVSRLSQACATHGHFEELHAALEIANPDLARKHCATLGDDVMSSGVVLSMQAGDEDGKFTNVLDAYLFGEASKTLGEVTLLANQLAKLSRLDREGKLRSGRLLIVDDSRES